MNDAIRMQVSAFVDGELPENEADLLVRRLSQDVVLRQQVAEYLAIGRVMRGEYGVQGVDVLRDRISMQLDDVPAQEVTDEDVQPSRSRLIRPLTGVAIAATVAVVAIFGLRQTVGIDVLNGDAPAVAGDVQLETVPTMSDDELREFLRIHNENSPAFHPRLASFELRSEELGEDDTDSESSEATDDADTVTSQPQ